MSFKKLWGWGQVILLNYEGTLVNGGDIKFSGLWEGFQSMVLGPFMGGGDNPVRSYASSELCIKLLINFYLKLMVTKLYISYLYNFLLKDVFTIYNCGKKCGDFLKKLQIFVSKQFHCDVMVTLENC